MASGGVEPRARKRSARALSLSEREEISRRLAQGAGVRAIARALRRPPSTVSREVSRNGGARSYRASAADQRAWDRGRRPKPCKLAKEGRLRRVVAGKLQELVSRAHSSRSTRIGRCSRYIRIGPST
ncbi:MAG: transposase [Nannocystales bacterium]